ncbi:polysaccharide deacetylase [Streptomyces sp. NPDC059070]|uniref:polysaccharide deacetylase n=1 Tax=Streptomyces sp. NPDC059070 TaxID=3346713 RepID=UPI0036B525AE
MVNGIISKSVRTLLTLSVTAVLAAAGAGAAQAQSHTSSLNASGKNTTARTSTEAAKAVVAAREHGARTAARGVCYRAHVAGIGWQSPVCNGQVAGTTGQGRAIEALEITTYGVGGMCAQAHVAGTGWQNVRCGADGQTVTVGTTGQSRPMEALWLSPSTGTVGAQAHVQNYGWMGWQNGNPITVGTTGAALRLEAVQIVV